MKSFLFIAIIAFLPLQPLLSQKIYSTNKGYISFFSKAPISDVDARNGKVKASLNTSTSELTLDITMADFQFKNRKMGRDARKNYIEIDKYPRAGFNGKITTDIPDNKPGTYQASATGKLKIHGTEKEVTEKGTVTVQKGKIILKSEFYVQLKDYNIETPKILGKEMTEDKILVKIEVTLTAKRGTNIATP